MTVDLKLKTQLPSDQRAETECGALSAETANGLDRGMIHVRRDAAGRIKFHRAARNRA